MPSRNTAFGHRLGGGPGRSSEPRCALRREATAAPACNSRHTPPESAKVTAEKVSSRE